MSDLTSARVLADSIHEPGARLITLEVTFPRFILAEFNTHRVFSRNSASSRAIPTSKQLDNIRKHPFVPQRFPVNRPGMSAVEYYEPGTVEHVRAETMWLRAREYALMIAESMHDMKVHKQIANRILEPFMWHTVIVSSTEWDNFFNLRISEFAQPEIKHTAELMRAAIEVSNPAYLEKDEWHLPLVDADEDLLLQDKIKCCVARCAAVSYNRHTERDIGKEIARYDQLAENGHLSPFEHAATPDPEGNANFWGWRQARWYIENGFLDGYAK